MRKVTDGAAQTRELTLTALGEYNLANEVVVTGDGEEALDYLYCRGKFQTRTSENPAVLLLDLKLPKVDGLEVLQRIKADEKLRMIPVVVLTSSKAEKDIVQSYQLHANCYITKPIDLMQMQEIVQNLKEFWFTVVRLPSENSDAR